MTRFGCCPDGRSVAAGGNFEGCPDENTYEESCTDSPFGCCPDNKTPAQGPHHALCPSRVDKGGKSTLNFLYILLYSFKLFCTEIKS